MASPSAIQIPIEFTSPQVDKFLALFERLVVAQERIAGSYVTVGYSGPEYRSSEQC